MKFYFYNRTQLLMRSGSWMINLRLEYVEASAEVRKSISRTQHEWTWQYIYILCDSFVALYLAWKLSIFVDDPIAQYQVLSHIVLLCTSAIFIGDADNQRMITGHIQYSSTCFVWDADIDVLMFVIAWYQVPSLVEILIFFLLTQTTPPKPKEKWVYKEINPTSMILLMESLYFFE